MPRKKTADKITSKNELLERIWLRSAQKLLAQLDQEEGTMTAAMFGTITKFLSLNNFDAAALAKVQYERKALEQHAKTGKIDTEGGPLERNVRGKPINYDVEPVDPLFELKLKEQLKDIPDFGPSERT